MSKFSEDDIARFREIFDLLDKDGDGMLTYKEITHAVRATGINPSEAQMSVCNLSHTFLDWTRVIMKFMQDMFNGSYADQFDFTEYLAILGRKPKFDDNTAKFQAAFAMFDQVRG